MGKSQVEPVSEQSNNDDDEVVSVERTEIARAVARLKDASFKTARERERVPQPLFWSLFSSQLQSIKKRKRQERLLTELFGSSDES